MFRKIFFPTFRCLKFVQPISSAEFSSVPSLNPNPATPPPPFPPPCAAAAVAAVCGPCAARRTRASGAPPPACAAAGRRSTAPDIKQKWTYNQRAFFTSLSAPHPKTDPRHSAHSFRAREGNEVQLERPQQTGATATRSSLPPHAGAPPPAGRSELRRRRPTRSLRGPAGAPVPPAAGVGEEGGARRFFSKSVDVGLINIKSIM
jgi:hypothetical protein